MRLRLVHQLSLLLVGTVLLAVLGMGLLTATQLRRGFNDYLRSQDESRLDAFAEAARLALSRHGVDGLAARPEALMAPLLGGSPPRGGPRPLPRDRDDGRPPPGRADDGAPRGFSVVDTAGRLIWGRRTPPGRESLQRAIEIDGQLVAYARLVPRPEANEAQDQRFLQRQFLSLAGLGLLVALLAAGAALLLAQRWTRPLAAAQAASHRLAQGDFGHRLAHRPSRFHDELDELALDLNRLAEALQRLDSSRRRWIAELSHELRTPLTVLRGELDAVADGVRPMDATRLASLQSEVTRLTRLADDFALLARADLEALPCEPRPQPPAPLLQAAFARWRGGMQAAGLQLELELGALPEAVAVDAARLHQVLDNLLGNALAYTDAPGQVRLWAALQAPWLVIGVDDSPPGVPDAAERERLFEPLYRRDAARQRRDGGGSGLGLAIARALVQAHGGRLSAETSPLGGLRLLMRLPLAGAR